MPMNSTSLANEIIAKYEAIRPEGSSAGDIDFVKALAEAIIEHIQNNAKATGSAAIGHTTHNLDIS